MLQIIQFRIHSDSLGRQAVIFMWEEQSAPHESKKQHLTVSLVIEEQTFVPQATAGHKVSLMTPN